MRVGEGEDGARPIAGGGVPDLAHRHPAGARRD